MGKLFWKFFLVFWLALLTMGAGIGTAIWLQRNAALNAAQNIEGKNLIDVHAEPFVESASLLLQKGGVVILHDFLKESVNTHSPPVYVVDGQGKDLLNRELTAGTIEQAKAMAITNPRIVRRVRADDGRTYLVFAPFPRDKQFQLSRQQSHRNQPTFRPRHSRPSPPPPWLPIILGFMVSLIFSGILAWYFAKPIRQLRSAFAAVADGNFNTRAAQTMGVRRDELADLGRSFDVMVGQIQLLVDAQQRLLHDVSHELRSPLARIQAAIGLAHQQPNKAPAILERIEKESQRMSDLIGELLTLSRLEAGVVGNLETIDINELISEIVEDTGLEADSKNVKIELSLPSQASITGRTEAIRRAIENVLRNAVKHTKNNSIVRVKVELDNTHNRVCIAIIDQGNGIDEKEIAHVFEPFFRGSNTQKINSTGLGLTIAQKAIEAHKGSITVTNKPEGGFQVNIILPIFLNTGPLKQLHGVLNP